MNETSTVPTKHKARIVTLQVLYEVDEAQHDALEILERRLHQDSLPTVVESFACWLIQGVLEHKALIDRMISILAPAWPLNQMAVVDRNILRIAIFEIRLGGKTPSKVAINEAVELAKVFGSDNSAKFVNGVLGSVIRTPLIQSK